MAASAHAQGPGNIKQLLKNHDYTGTILAGRAYLQSNPNSAEVYRFMSKSFYQQKEYDSAAYFMEKSFAFDSVFSPRATTWYIAGILGGLRQLAEMHIQAGDTARGISELYTVLHIKPRNVTADSARALLAILGHDPDSVFQEPQQWEVVHGKHIDYYFEDTIGPHVFLSAFISRYEAAFDTLNAFFQAALSQKIRYYVYLDKSRAHKYIGDDESGNANAELYRIRTGFLGYYPAGHEIAHILVFYAWGSKPRYTDRFVNEGLAVAFDFDGDKDKMARATQELAGSKFHSVRKIWEQEDWLEKKIFYPVAGAFIQYLYQHGAILDFKQLVKWQTLEGAMNIYGKPDLKKLMNDFDKEVGLMKENPR